jgi:hypothetical protein
MFKFVLGLARTPYYEDEISKLCGIYTLLFFV